MRCIFSKGKQRELLVLTKEKLDISWRELAGKLGIGYTTLRDWRDEKWSMRLEVFNKIVEACPEQKCFEVFITETKEDSCGREIGGVSTKQRKHGFLNPAYIQQSLTWKSKGGQIGTSKWHATMKKERPEEYGKIQYERIKQSLNYKCKFNGRKYRNILELEVAKILTENAIKFEYERPISCVSRTYFPDFIVGRIAVECTFWDDANQKAKALTKKIRSYRKLGLETVVVTKEPYLERYLEALASMNVKVITPNNLTQVLDGKFGRVKRA